MKNRHHRKCRSQGGRNGRGNVVLVDSQKHQYFHYLFKRADGTCMTPEEIGRKLSETWINSEYEIIVRRK